MSSLFRAEEGPGEIAGGDGGAEPAAAGDPRQAGAGEEHAPGRQGGQQLQGQGAQGEGTVFFNVFYKEMDVIIDSGKIGTQNGRRGHCAKYIGTYS